MANTTTTAIAQNLNPINPKASHLSLGVFSGWARDQWTRREKFKPGCNDCAGPRAPLLDVYGVAAKELQLCKHGLGWAPRQLSERTAELLGPVARPQEPRGPNPGWQSIEAVLCSVGSYPFLPENGARFHILFAWRSSSRWLPAFSRLQIPNPVHVQGTTAWSYIGSWKWSFIK